MSGRDGDGHAVCCPSGRHGFWGEENQWCIATGSRCMGGGLKRDSAVQVQGWNLWASIFQVGAPRRLPSGLTRRGDFEASTVLYVYSTGWISGMHLYSSEVGNLHYFLRRLNSVIC